jgi:hypothetical protein
MPGLLWEHSGKFLGFSAQDDQGNWSWLQYALQSPIIGWKFAGTADFTGEGYPDVLFQRQEGKYEVALWTMNGPSVAASSVLAYPDPKWKIAGTGDFDGDGYNDTFWQHETGWLGIWLMRGTNSAAAGRWVQLEHYSMTGHQIAGAADLTGDGRPDLVWQHPESGVTVWPMEGTNIVKQAGGQAAGVSLGLLAGRGWAVVAMGDFTRDGRVDLLLRNASTGGLELWSVSGPPLAARKLVRLAESGDLNWRAVGFFASRLPTNAKPFAAQLTSPTDSAAFKAPAEFAITAALENPGLSCARVEFFEGSQRVGIAYAAPYTCGWHATVPGTYVYTAKATDALGRVVYSPAAVVTVR